jgi:hypothetical protein
LGKARNVYQILLVNLTGKETTFRYLGMDGRILLKCNLKTWVVTISDGLI